MKKLLFGLLVIGSLSGFSQENSYYKDIYLSDIEIGTKLILRKDLNIEAAIDLLPNKILKLGSNDMGDCSLAIKKVNNDRSEESKLPIVGDELKITRTDYKSELGTYLYVDNNTIEYIHCGFWVDVSDFVDIVHDYFGVDNTEYVLLSVDKRMLDLGITIDLEEDNYKPDTDQAERDQKAPKSSSAVSMRNIIAVAKSQRVKSEEVRHRCTAWANITGLRSGTTQDFPISSYGNSKEDAKSNSLRKCESFGSNKAKDRKTRFSGCRIETCKKTKL